MCKKNIVHTVSRGGAMPPLVNSRGGSCPPAPHVPAPLCPKAPMWQLLWVTMLTKPEQTRVNTTLV